MLWLNGGPGGSSMMGLLEENGPCMIAADSAGAVPNPWSWNNEVNMLYVDQPAQVGFSYDVAELVAAITHEDERAKRAGGARPEDGATGGRPALPGQVAAAARRARRKEGDWEKKR